MLDASGHTLKINRYIVDENFTLNDAFGDDEQAKLEAAIDMARERTRLYFIPATWTAKRNVKGTITVTRYHR